MITYIETDGTLHIAAENKLEIYALRKWLDAQKTERDFKRHVVIDTSRDKEDNVPLGVS